MKVVLLNPNVDQRRLTRHHSVLPPLGLAYIAGAIKDAMEVEIIDAEALNLSDSDVLIRITRSRPEVIGITSTTPIFAKTRGIISHIKQATSATVVLGGPHASACPREVLDFPAIDFVVIGEGEQIFAQLCSSFADGSRGYSSIPGLAYRIKDHIIVNKSPGPIADLDQLNVPPWSLFPIGAYRTPHALRSPLVSIMTSRGCPYACTFCANHVIAGRRVRLRSIDNVMAEIEQAHSDYGIREFAVLDDCFTYDPERTLRLCDRMQDLASDLSWYCNTRVDKISAELLRAMKAAGCHEIYFGCESGDSTILRRIHKGITRRQIIDAVRLTKDAGITAELGFIVGFPFDTEETVTRTVDLAIEANPDKVQFSAFLPMPGTEFWDMPGVRYDYLNENTHYGFHASSVHRTVRSSSISEALYQKTIEYQQFAYNRYYEATRRVR